MTPELYADFDFQRGDFSLRLAFQSTSQTRILGVYGASGAGKSTLLHLCAGLLRPRTGFLRYDSRVLFSRGMPVDKADSTAYSDVNIDPATRGIGYIFQDARVFPRMSVRQNVLYGARRALNIAAESGNDPFDLEKIIALMNLREIWNRRGDQLSGGQQKRVAIARALFSRPALLLCDEACNGLDATTRKKFLAYLGELPAGMRVVYVSHDLAELARLTDEILLLERGRLIFHGALDRLLKEPGSRKILTREGVTPPAIVRRADMAEAFLSRPGVRISAVFRDAPFDAKFVLRTEYLHLLGAAQESAFDTSFPDQWPARFLGYMDAARARIELFDSGRECVVALPDLDSGAKRSWRPGDALLCLVHADALRII